MKKFLLKHTRLITNKEKSQKLYKKFEISTLLDLGSGANPHSSIREELAINCLLVDLHPKDLDANVLRTDVRNSEVITNSIWERFGERKVDCVVALHLIEHFNKDESLIFLQEIEKYAKKLIILETPNGFLYQDSLPDNPFQKHLCGYTIKELREKGYRVTGTTGLKFLRNNFDKGSYRGSWIFLHTLDRLLFKFLHVFPGISFNLFAYKVMPELKRLKRFDGIKSA